MVVGGFGLQADKEAPNFPQFNSHSRREAALTLVAAYRDAAILDLIEKNNILGFLNGRLQVQLHGFENFMGR